MGTRTRTPTHDTLSASCYRNHRCRKPECVAAWGAYLKERHDKRVALGRADPSLIPHGTRRGYADWDCRCEDCAEAWRVARGYTRQGPDRELVPPRPHKPRCNCEPCTRRRQTIRRREEARAALTGFTPEELARATRVALANAIDVADARELLDAIGLEPRYLAARRET